MNKNYKTIVAKQLTKELSEEYGEKIVVSMVDFVEVLRAWETLKATRAKVKLRAIQDKIEENHMIRTLNQHIVGTKEYDREEYSKICKYKQQLLKKAA